MSNARLYIGRLSNRASERDVEYFFRGYGKIRDVICKDGFGFIEFDDPRDAEDAIYDLNGKELMGDRVILEHTKRPGFRGYPSSGGGGSRYGGGGGYGGGRGGGDRMGRGPPQWLSKYGAPDQTKYRMVIENLSTKYSWQDLKDTFREYGVDGMGYADAHRIKRNEAIICFLTHSDLRRAMDKMDGRELNGRKIKCMDETRDSRSRSPRSHSRSRSRSPRSRSPRSRSRSGSRAGSRGGSRSRSASPRSDREQEAAPADA